MIKALISNQCFGLDTPINIERAKTIVVSYLGEVLEEELKKFCEEAKEKYQIEERKKRFEEQEKEEKRLNEIREKEKGFYNYTTKYAFLYGREKRKQYYLDKAESAWEYAVASAKRRNMSQAAYQNANQLAGGTNADWAIVGGIANALGGPAAGVMAAGEIQAKNAAAEPLKQEIQRNAIRASVEEDIKVDKYSKESENFKNIAENMNAKLVDDKDPDGLFEKIQPKVQEFSVTETGAVKAVITTKAAKVKIFETVDAFIDGTIKAKVMDANKEVGEILFVLPENGSTNDETIEGICISLKQPKVKYELILEPNKLWAIEI